MKAHGPATTFIVGFVGGCVVGALTLLSFGFHA